MDGEHNGSYQREKNQGVGEITKGTQLSGDGQ